MRSSERPGTPGGGSPLKPSWGCSSSLRANPIPLERAFLRVPAVPHPGAAGGAAGLPDRQPGAVQRDARAPEGPPRRDGALPLQVRPDGGLQGAGRGRGAGDGGADAGRPAGQGPAPLPRVPKGLDGPAASPASRAPTAGTPSTSGSGARTPGCCRRAGGCGSRRSWAGPCKLKQHRPLEGTPKTAHLVLRADGHWYVLIVCAPAPPELPRRRHARPGRSRGPPRAIGLDVGLRHFLADSEGRTVANPQHLRRAERTLRRQQRTLSRRKRGSHRRRKAARSVARTHLTVARQRRDFHFKTAKGYAERYDRIYVEDLQHRRDGRGTAIWPRASSTPPGAPSWTSCRTRLQRAGHAVVRVPARFTSQRCSRCGEIVPKTLSRPHPRLSPLRVRRRPGHQRRAQHPPPRTRAGHGWGTAVAAQPGRWSWCGEKPAPLGAGVVTTGCCG